MNLVTGQDDIIIPWLAQTYGAHVVQTPRVVLGIVDKYSVLRGAFVLTWQHDRTAELHVFGQTSPDTAKALFFYAFKGCNVWRLMVRTSKRNKAIKKAAPKFGFSFQCVEKDFYGPGDDALAFYMLPTQCRWLNADARTLERAA